VVTLVSHCWWLWDHSLINCLTDSSENSFVHGWSAAFVRTPAECCHGGLFFAQHQRCSRSLEDHSFINKILHIPTNCPNENSKFDDVGYSSTETTCSTRRPDSELMKIWLKFRVHCWYGLNPVDWRLLGRFSDKELKEKEPRQCILNIIDCTIYLWVTCERPTPARTKDTRR
jgi:hypothetical protein